MDIGQLMTAVFAAEDAYRANPGQAEYDAILALVDQLNVVRPSSQWDAFVPPPPDGGAMGGPSGQDPVGNPE